MSFLWQMNIYPDFVTFVTFDTVKLRNNTKKKKTFLVSALQTCKHVSDWLSPPKITKYIFGDSEYCVYEIAHEKEFKNRWRDWQCKKFKYLKKMRPRVSWCVTQNGVVISVTASLQCFTNRKRTTIRKLGVRLLAPLRIPLWKFADRTALSSRKESGNNFIWLTFGGRCGIDICCVKRPNESALQPVALSLIVF